MIGQQQLAELQRDCRSSRLLQPPTSTSGRQHSVTAAAEGNSRTGTGNE